MKPKNIRDRENTERILIMMWPFYSHKYPDLPVEKIRSFSDEQIEAIDLQLFLSLCSAMELVDFYIYG